jgi:hypothetical protein
MRGAHLVQAIAVGVDTGLRNSGLAAIPKVRVVGTREELVPAVRCACTVQGLVEACHVCILQGFSTCCRVSLVRFIALVRWCAPQPLWLQFNQICSTLMCRAANHGRWISL